MHVFINFGVVFGVFLHLNILFVVLLKIRDLSNSQSNELAGIWSTANNPCMISSWYFEKEKHFTVFGCFRLFST
jgi:ABC-type sulfate transport system permease component